MMVIGQPGFLKKYNCDIVENIIFERGPITKPEIAQATSLSLPTVNKAVDELEQNRIVRIDESAQGSGVGRKAKYYIANENLGEVIVISHLDSRWYGALIDFVGKIKEEQSVPIANENLQDSLSCIFKLIDGFREHCSNLLTIGIGIPGVVLADGTIGSIPTIPAWEDLPLQHTLEKKYGVPVLVENDVNLMTRGYASANLPEVDNLLFFYFGLGIGSGMILNKTLYKGFSGFAGEFGFMDAYGQNLDRNAPIEKDLSTLLQHLQVSPEDQETRLQYYNLIIKVIINAISMLNPNVVVIHGIGLGKEALPYFENALSRHFPSIHQPELRITENRNYGMTGLIHACLSGLLERCHQFETGRSV